MKIFQKFRLAFYFLLISNLISSLFIISLSAQAIETKHSVKAAYLTCPIVRQRVNDFLRYHYIFHDFNDELSSRNFQSYFKLLDPGKMYFLQSDIDYFAKFKGLIGKNINNGDCQFIQEVYDLYKQRVSSANKTLQSILKKPFDFKKKEFIETDRKKINWAKNETELNDRWKKTLKFIVLNMKDSNDTTKIIARLKKRYEIILKNVLTRNSDEIHAIFLNAFALSLDPHSSFLTPDDNAQFQIDFSLKLVGIGATLMSPDGYTTIDSVVPGGAASIDGRLKKGDRIIAVDSGDGSGLQDVIDMDLQKVVQLIRGKKGTIVKLLIMRKSQGSKIDRFQIELKRAVVQIKDSEAKSDVLNINSKKIGIINLPSFYIDYQACQESPTNCRSSANDMAREIKKLKAENIDGMILDLRRNGGGDLSEVQKIVGLFINDPVVTQIEDRDHQVRSLESNSNALYIGPLGILVSKYTASASEILAGSVQDYGRGLILGDSRTFGKGTVQTVIEVPGTSGRQTNGAIHVTIAKFFRPSGKSNQEKGILSDVVIPDIIDASTVGELESDYSLPYTVIPKSNDFAPLQNLEPILPILKKNSSARVSKSPEFKTLLESIKKINDDKNTLVALTEESTKKISQKTKSKKLKKNSSESDDLPDFSVKVISKNDIGLKEGAAILLDGIQLLNSKKDWTSHDNQPKFSTSH